MTDQTIQERNPDRDPRSNLKVLRVMTTELTLNLSFQNEQWWIAADRELLDAISGGILY